MEHIKNYWWVYLLLAIAIYWYFFFSFMGPSRYEAWRDKNKPLLQVKEGSSCVKTHQGCQPGGIPFPEGFVCPPGNSWTENGVWKDGKCDTSMSPNRP